MKVSKRQLRRIIREALTSMTMDQEMEIRDTAINIFKGGGDREEVVATIHELFPEAYDFIDTIIDDAEEMLETGVR